MSALAKLFAESSIFPRKQPQTLQQPPLKPQPHRCPPVPRTVACYESLAGAVLGLVGELCHLCSNMPGSVTCETAKLDEEVGRLAIQIAVVRLVHRKHAADRKRMPECLWQRQEIRVRYEAVCTCHGICLGAEQGSKVLGLWDCSSLNDLSKLEQVQGGNDPALRISRASLFGKVRLTALDTPCTLLPSHRWGRLGEA